MEALLMNMHPLHRDQSATPPPQSVLGSESSPMYNGRKMRTGGVLTRENDWIQQVANGNLRAFEALCSSYYKRLYSYVFKMVGNNAEVEEVLNDTFHGIWRGASGYKGSAKPSTWIFGIARRRAVSGLVKHREETLEGEQVEEPADPTPRVDEQLARKDLVNRALAQLSPEHREVIELTFYSGMSYPEIASVVSVPVNTVKTRMFHARKQLRQTLNRLAKGEQRELET